MNIVSIVGIIALCIGALGLLHPKLIGTLVSICTGAFRFWLAILARVVLGILFLVVAPHCEVPVLVQVIGGISLLAAVVILMMGQESLDATIEWWLARPQTWVRASALFAFAFGWLMLYAA